MDGHDIFDQQRTISPELAELIDAAIVRALIGRILGVSLQPGTLIEVTVAGAAHWSE